MCTQKVPYCYMPINIFVIALLKNMNLVCPVIAAFAEISTSFNTKLTHTLITNRYKFDDMNNGFGWNRLPKSFMSENTVFLLLTALIHNFYKTIISKLDTKAFGLKETSRIKAFVFSFISVPAKWIMTARQYVLNIYTENRAYAKPFKTGFG